MVIQNVPAVLQVKKKNFVLYRGVLDSNIGYSECFNDFPQHLDANSASFLTISY
jgi:hypothetical protein